MINRRRSGARGTPAKVNATAGLEASEGVNSASVSDGSHESVYLCPFYVLTPNWPVSVPDRDRGANKGSGGGKNGGGHDLFFYHTAMTVEDS